MAESLIQGIILSKIPFGENDEIIRLLTNEDEYLGIFSRGSRKIISKNARNLFEGSLVELEVFRSRDNEKMSLLKKAAIKERLINIEEGKYSLEDELSLEYHDRGRPEGHSFSFIVTYFKERNPIQEVRIADLLVYIIKKSGISPKLDACIRCGSKRAARLSLRLNGIICVNCDRELEADVFSPLASKLLYEAFRGHKSNWMLISPIDFRLLLIECCLYIDNNFGRKLNSLSEITRLLESRNASKAANPLIS